MNLVLIMSNPLTLFIEQAIVRVVIVLATHFGWKISQLDVCNAFLHWILQEDAYLAQPPIFIDPYVPCYFFNLNRAIYGKKKNAF